jgi:glycerol-3-phosphate cytidylyltransferase
MSIGYTTGVYDLFHVGHVNLLKRARGLCDQLIVGVSSDELVKAEKSRETVIPFEERCEILEACKYVDVVVRQDDRDKVKAWGRLKFDMLFVGDDWYQSEKWMIMEEQFSEKGVKVVYFPYTQSTSSTKINGILTSRT